MKMRQGDVLGKRQYPDILRLHSHCGIVVVM
jgi:hypothetical protein